ncbi:hypothetical protein [Mucilaginibacter agri]|uniref:Uncharacterized protein n=1 Tax=Mucilaginibacter agri TaxID=2695265 RepID=A0A965ZEG4_9SPHI|nr:hypothetical protein [Mucilaginibacter agri]NCD69360.1 hypothetical protein [Mucilaginibacter agri]
MKPTEIVIQTYEQLKAEITGKLSHQGYLPVHDQHDDPLFFSRYMIWSNNEEALRLTWDGKEQWFALEVTQDLPLKALSAWSQIMVVPYDVKNKQQAYSDDVIHKIMGSLE